jgi:glycosyltransferase involved in cell wall biosynthesis
MKISVLHYAVPPVVGGAEHVIEQHARLMTKAGHSVRLIGGRGAAYDPQIEFFPLPLLDSRHPEILAAKAELDEGRVPAAFASLVDSLVLQLSEGLAGSDVVIIHNICSLHLNLVATAALKRLSEKSDSFRFILWHHDLAWTTPRYRQELHPGWPWDLIRSNWDNVIHVAVSELRKRELIELIHIHADQVAVVPSGVDLAAFLKLGPAATEFAAELNLFQAEPLLLLPVRLTPRKNIELALQTLAILRQGAFPTAKLVITGPIGPHNPANINYFQRLTDLRAELNLKDSAHFLAEFSDSFLPHSTISDFYRIADALILPSKEEGFGIPILEASLAHLPIFCTDIPPLRETGGDLVNYFSPDDMPQDVATLISSRLSENGSLSLRTRVRRQYDWDRIFTQQIEPLLIKAAKP